MVIEVHVVTDHVYGAVIMAYLYVFE